MFDGHLNLILTEFEQAGLADATAYIQTHQTRMHYADFQEEGFPIGSGSVESEVKQFDGPGMY